MIDFKKKAEELHFNPAEGFLKVEMIEQALKEAYNQGIDESAKIAGDVRMRFQSEQESVCDAILALKIKP